MGDKTPPAFVLSCQAFVASQKGEGEASHLGHSSPSLLSSHSTTPYLSTHRGI